MKKENRELKVHLFVCTHHKEGKDNCADRNSQELCDTLRKWAKENHSKDVKVTKSGCLGKCSDGIAMVMYPQQKLITEVRLKDADEIKEYIEKKLDD